MDLHDLWQENKRFAVGVTAGVIVFAIGSMVINGLYRADLVQARRSVSSTTAKLKSDAMYSADDLALAQSEHEALEKCVATLRGAVDFDTRERFRFDPERGSASNQYFAAVSEAREEILTLAGRTNLRLPEEVGLPALSPTREGDIVRHLEALDLIDRVLRLCMAAGVARVEEIQIKLDPKLATPDGAGPVELTRVEISLSGRPAPLVQFLKLSQDPRELEATLGSAQPLLIEKLEMQPARSKTDEAGLEATFLVARLEPAKAQGD